MIDSVSDEGEKKAEARKSKFNQAMASVKPAPQEPVKQEAPHEPSAENQASLKVEPPMITPGPDFKRAARVRYDKQMAPTIDRLPPHSPDAEMGTLGSVLNTMLLSDEGEAWPRIDFLITRFREGSKDVYYDLRHQIIFNGMVEMRNQNKKVDVITLQQWLKDRKLLEQCGGIAYLSSLIDVGLPSMMAYYAEIIFEKYVLRKTIHTCTDVVSKIYDHEGEIDLVMDGIEKDMTGIMRLRAVGQRKSLTESIVKSLQTVEDHSASDGKLLGLSTGFADFDAITGGLSPAEMIVIAARPSVGKTSLAMNIAEHVAMVEKKPVGIFSLEMKMDALVLRMLCSRSKVNLKNIRDGFFSEQEFERVRREALNLKNAPIHIDDERGISMMQLKSKARQMVQEFEIKLFVIDYLSLLHATIGNKRVFNRRDEVTEISHGIKELAGELDVPVIVLSQLNRDVEKFGKKGKPRKPRMSDLRESGEIEQDADLIGLLYSPEDEDDTPQDPNSLRVTLNIAKQRNGPTGDVHLLFMKTFTRFENASRISEEDIPGKTTLF